MEFLDGKAVKVDEIGSIRADTLSTLEKENGALAGGTSSGCIEVDLEEDQ